MTDLLSIGASGARAYQSALATTSDNIANAATVGYSRRVATVREVVATGGNTSAISSGLGANVGGVTRAADAFRATEVRTASSDLARTLAGAAWLGRIDSGLTQNKLGDQLTAFFTSAKAVAADPTALPARATMLENASSVAAAFGATGKALDGAMADLKASAETGVTQLNNLSASLAKVNAGLARATDGTAGQAALLDQRDQMLEQMSALTDVTVSFDTYGRATVQAGNSAGPTLVEGAQSAIVSQVSNDEGTFSFSVKQASGAVQTMAPNGGALAGIAESGSRIAAARDQISQMAQSFAEGVNAVQAAGADLQGNAGQPVFSVGDPAYNLTVVMTDPRGIAAAAPGGGTRDNSNLAGFDTLRTSGNYEQQVTDLTAANGAALSGRNSVADAQTSIRDSAVSARDSVSGVNIDEEAVDLMRFQQAYQASTRVIQVARETLQSILDIR
ncbi:flagellar hook-associated protein FlgK [Sphingomonas kyeonggiensis]|uniref:Flagellar hook-associated protein 1 n=1 Tax=Sphingomonas kyeonggiensis TaxID=1268553 RepID=A0A7W6NYJ3_9SPHN|nr:flagellar hook-associated protein FlgK [Sphingomonas kyeonggiensis]MBB4099846.1 flagellar hook-associated protein 1 FlgK [Sphingomonas kyeonggiensis]